MDIKEKDFEKEVLGAEVPVIVDFWAPWCGYCRRLSPAVDRLEEEMEGKIKVAKVNIDESVSLAEKYEIEVIPTLMLFQDGKLVSSAVNPGSQDGIEEWLKENQAI